MMGNNCHLPHDTETVLKNLKPKNIENLSLALNKNGCIPDGDKRFNFLKRFQRRFPLPEETMRRINDYYSRIKKNNTSIDVTMRCATNSRLVVGLGCESVYETSLTLHHIYGIPYIPGQAIKGIVRNYITVSAFGKNQSEEMDCNGAERRALGDKAFCSFFGNRKEQGKIVFFDAFPAGEYSLRVDIMNPHYGEYYSGNGNDNPPADYYNPKPVFFLTVEKTSFRFIIGRPGQRSFDIMSKVIDGKKIYDWIREALSNYGIGAKTAVGYGFFSKK